jgi:hypothetical protein
MTPYEKLKSLGYTTPQEFCLFPTLILDRLVSLPKITNYPKSVQDHLDYNLKGWASRAGSSQPLDQSLSQFEYPSWQVKEQVSF